MKYPNAYAGIKKIFVSQILEIISVILFLIGMIAVIAGAVSLTGETEVAAAGLVTAGVGVILAIAGSIIAIIALILNLIGLNKAKKDEKNFQYAFWFVIIGLAATIITTFVQTANPWLAGWLEFVGTVMTVCAIEYSIVAIINLASAVGNESVEKLGRFSRILVTILWVVVVIMRVWRNELAANSTVSNIVAIVYLILELLVYILYIVLLSKAKKMLQE